LEIEEVGEAVLLPVVPTPGAQASWNDLLPPFQFFGPAGSRKDPAGAKMEP